MPIGESEMGSRRENVKMTIVLRRNSFEFDEQK
jgi:hypothetical protein